MRKTAFVATMLMLFTLSLAWSATKDREYATASFHGTQARSGIYGQAMFVQTKGGLQLRATVFGLSPGKHGFHIHEYGQCGHEGKDAGDHFNPDQHLHGDRSAQSRHAGDLGNLEADSSGKAEYEAFLPNLTLQDGRYNVALRSLIIHENEDTFGQPSGNSGARIACGIILPGGKS